MQTMRKSTAIMLGIIALSFIIAIYLYPIMPEQMASHWNTAGEVDGYMSKFWGLFLMPFFSVGIFLLFLVIPKIDPLKANIEKFRNYFDGFIVLIMAFFFYIYVLILLWSLEYRFNMTGMMLPAFAILFYYAGVLIENAKRNWFVGIRTPWTLSNEKVWNKTHKIGAKLFKAAALISLLGLVFMDYAIWFMVGPILVFVVYLVVYSYLEYAKETKK